MCIRVIYSLLFLISSVGHSFAQIPDTLWSRSFDWASVEIAYSVEVTFDGGYILTGYTGQYPNYDLFIMKLDSYGDSLWCKRYGYYSRNEGFSIRELADKGFVIAGATGAGVSDVYLIRTDSLGDTLWTSVYGSSQHEAGRSVCVTEDNCYIVTGYKYDETFMSSDILIVKFDEDGNMLWNKIYNGNSLYAYAYDIIETHDGNYVIVGGYDYDVFIVKTDGNGDSLWMSIMNVAGMQCGESIQQTDDDGFIIAGDAGYVDDVYVLRTDSCGDPRWTTTFGGTDWDAGMSVQIIHDGYIVAGVTSSFGAGETDMYIIKLNDTGDSVWTATYGGPLGEAAYDIDVTADSGYIVCGSCNGVGSTCDIYVVRLAPDTLGIEEYEAINSVALRSRIWPNPTCRTCNITYHVSDCSTVNVIIYDALGQRVMDVLDDENEPGMYTKHINTSMLPNGVYFVRINIGTKTDVKKLILIK